MYHRRRRRLQDNVADKLIFRLAGTIIRMAPERPAHCAMDWTPADSRKKSDRPKMGGLA